jgi:hypothetical protein
MVLLCSLLHFIATRPLCIQWLPYTLQSIPRVATLMLLHDIKITHPHAMRVWHEGKVNRHALIKLFHSDFYS